MDIYMNVSKTGLRRVRSLLQLAERLKSRNKYSSTVAMTKAHKGQAPYSEHDYPIECIIKSKPNQSPVD